MHVTDPEVVKTVTMKRSAPKVGGTQSPTPKAAWLTLAFENDVEALLMLRRLYNYLQQP
jgi:propionyl-CoA carboxylase beta chain